MLNKQISQTDKSALTSAALTLTKHTLGLRWFP